MMCRKFFKLFTHCTVPSVEATSKTASGHENSFENPNIKRDIWTNKVKYVAGKRFKIHIALLFSVHSAFKVKFNFSLILQL